MDSGRYDCLSMGHFLAQVPAIEAPRPQKGGVRFDNGGPGDVGYDTDESWTIEDALDSFYADMRNQLHAFALSTTQRSFTTTHLSKSQRRYVHATAHVLGLDHVSIGSKRRFRQMVISKVEPPTLGLDPFLSLPEEYLSTSAPAGPILANEAVLDQTDLPIRATSLNNIYAANPANTGDGYETERTERAIPKKRKRLPKQEGGFHCTFEGCPRVYDRASDRKKHEQVHQPALAQRHRCTHCNKGFRYPKDLRRHLKRHGIDASTESTAASSSSIADMTPMTYGSEAESTASLSFISPPSSVDLVSTWLDRSEHDPSNHQLSDLGGELEWSNMKDFLGIYEDLDGQGEDDAGEEEDFLEMPRVCRT